MLHKPTLTISRLVVTKGGQRVFDQSFHLGLNVIRGENGSGKTTVADFLFFGLGGDTPSWRAEAAICDYVFVEVLINGQSVTFRRQVEEERFRPMAIFWGTLDESEKMGTEWQLYPYAASATKESFSQAVFRAAGIPEIKATTSKITLHQVLRLIYVDQKTDYEQLFRTELFDSPLTRQAVGDLLCGVYDGRLYEAELMVVEKEAHRGRLQSELRAIYAILGTSGIPDPAWLTEEKSKYLTERDAAYARLKTLGQKPESSSADPLATRRAQIAGDLAKQNELVRGLEIDVIQIQTDIADRDQFLAALSLRLNALEESESTHESLGTFSFKFCPACYAPLTFDGNACHLCRNPVETGKGQNLLALRRELEQQISESQQLQLTMHERLNDALKKLPAEKNQQRTLQLQYDEIATAVMPSIGAILAEQHRRIGYLDRTIEELERRSQLAARLAEISTQQANLSAEISKLTDEIAARKVAQQQIMEDVYKTVATITRDLLKRDLPREEIFMKAERVEFDFGGNHISVNGKRTFAASSNVYLKNAFHLALFQSSLTRDYMRYPRLAIFDNVEDKGMEPARSHNFQKLVQELSDSTELDHQIILFTSMVEPSFESAPELLIGPHYKHDYKTLRIGSVTS